VIETMRALPEEADVGVTRQLMIVEGATTTRALPKNVVDPIRGAFSQASTGR